jgi:hypothetical protein
MYHFVKFNSTWYLKPECLQDVIDHFNKLCGREFKHGFEDFRDNVRVYRDKDGNVKNLSYTSQLRDYFGFANSNGLKMELYIRPSTNLSGPLQSAIKEMGVIIRYIH